MAPAMVTVRFPRVLVFFLFLAILGTGKEPRSQGVASRTRERTALLEDVYVVRTIRETTAGPSAFCNEERVGFRDVRAEDRYTLRSTTTRTSDGLMTHADVAPVGSLRACFGRTADPATASFYGEFVLASMTFKAIGECRTARTNYPAQGLTILRCASELRDLPSAYIGGQLTTNSLTSQAAAGDRTEPEEYIQSSVVTIRIWRKR